MNAHAGTNTANDGAGGTIAQGPVTFVITFNIKPDHRDEFHTLLGKVLDAMRNEPTFINAVLHRDAQDSAKVMLYETWADYDDVVNTQIQREYRKPYWDRLPELLVETQRIETWYPTRSDFAERAALRELDPA
ncbi:putative quinol monooxygenase [Microvirga brassicacearum]|uniref:Antibiotic biosynthesis monooxygenase n=1 Tax=Microvirga brassicacearum TaxID=2580413 RepID=A0A5N3P5N4_9HYPH|nr:putative quinol monooxygenase [Microvirga brassicacearum]KAB0265040.1 antibiotic biosynthesis monooxygenase [Microvirga brassicacearum]